MTTPEAQAEAALKNLTDKIAAQRKAGTLRPEVEAQAHIVALDLKAFTCGAHRSPGWREAAAREVAKLAELTSGGNTTNVTSATTGD